MLTSAPEFGPENRGGHRYHGGLGPCCCSEREGSRAVLRCVCVFVATLSMPQGFLPPNFSTKTLEIITLLRRHKSCTGMA